MFKMKNIYQEIDIGDWSGGYSSSSSYSENIKNKDGNTLTKSTDNESKTSSHEPVDNTVIFTTMFSSML